MPDQRRESVIFLAARLRDRAYQWIESEMDQRGMEGLSLSHGAILMHVGQRGPMTMGELSQILEKSRSTTTALVGKLEAREFVKQIVDPNDQRIRRVALTDKVLERTEELKAVTDGVLEKTFAGLSEEEQQTLVSFLGRTLENYR